MNDSNSNKSMVKVVTLIAIALFGILFLCIIQEYRQQKYERKANEAVEKIDSLFENLYK